MSFPEFEIEVGQAHLAEIRRDMDRCHRVDQALKLTRQDEVASHQSGPFRRLRIASGRLVNSLGRSFIVLGRMLEDGTMDLVP